MADLVKKNFTTAIDTEEQKRLNAPSIALLDSWLAEARGPATPEQVAEAEAEQAEFMRNLNLPRKEAGERLHFPHAEKSPE